MEPTGNRQASTSASASSQQRCVTMLSCCSHWLTNVYLAFTRTYELSIMQQPRVGAEAGMGRSTVGRVRLGAPTARPSASY